MIDTEDFQNYGTDINNSVHASELRILASYIIHASLHIKICLVRIILDPKQEEEAKKLFIEAMKNGHVTSQHVVIILVGIAGSGKSSFKRVVLDLQPEETRVSTALAEAVIRNISISRAMFGNSDSVEWEMVESEDLLSMLADAIKAGPGEQNDTATPSSATSSSNSAPTNGTPTVTVEGSLASLKSCDFKPPSSFRPTSQDYSARAAIGNRASILFDDDSLKFEADHDPLLPLIGKSQGDRRLLRVHWVYIIDTGGQPQFLQLLPAFIKSISACACFLRLDQDLDDQPIVKYFDKSGLQCGESYKSEHTNLQVVESCVRTILSRSCVNSDKPPKCFVIGTHRDMYEQASVQCELIAVKNERLIKQLSNVQLKQSLIFYAGGDVKRLIFPLNCKNPEEQDRKVAAEFRKCVMDHCSEPEVKIPLAWFVLEERIRQYAVERGVAYVKKATCQKIASHLHMSHKMFEAALNHLLKTNIFRCYDCLPHLIFCDTQVVLLKLTELVQHSFKLKKGEIRGLVLEDLNFISEAKFSINFLKRFDSYYSELFTPECFLKILLELLTVADMQKGDYFMPCLLKELKKDEISTYRSSSKLLSTLLILLEDGYLPNGIFTSLIAALQNNYGWELAYREFQSQPACLYQNCVMFRIPGKLPGKVTLIASFQYLEIHLCVADVVKHKIDTLCARVFSDITCGLDEAWKHLYPGEFSVKLAFFCDSCCSTSISTDCSSELHHADISDDGEYEICSKDQINGMFLCDSKLRWLRNIGTYVNNIIISPINLLFFQITSTLTH